MQAIVIQAMGAVGQFLGPVLGSPLIGTISSGLISAFIVYHFGIRQLAHTRKEEFRQQQLAEFYAPLTGMVKQIRAEIEIAHKVSLAANVAWQKICERHKGQNWDSSEEYAPFHRIIEYDNEKLKRDLVPRYQEMLRLFTERYHFATAETRRHYQAFLEFVELWNRFLADALPGEVTQELSISEEEILPFYQHIEEMVQTLQTEILNGG